MKKEESVGSETSSGARTFAIKIKQLETAYFVSVQKCAVG